MAVFGLLLLGGGQVVGLVAGGVVIGCTRGCLRPGGAGVLGAEVGGVAPALLVGVLFPLFGVAVDGPQDEQDHRQPGRKAQ